MSTPPKKPPPITGTIVDIDRTNRFRPDCVVHYEFEDQEFEIRFPFDEPSGKEQIWRFSDEDLRGSKFTFASVTHIKPGRGDPPHTRITKTKKQNYHKSIAKKHSIGPKAQAFLRDREPSTDNLGATRAPAQSSRAPITTDTDSRRPSLFEEPA